MNLPQIIRKARLGCDAILPGNTPSTLWADDELVDLVNESNDAINNQLRLGRKNFGLQTVKYGDDAYTRGGITYDPSVALSVAAGATSFPLPPDFAEVSRILGISDTTIRFGPGEYNSQYWIERLQRSYSLDGTFIESSTVESTFNYDIIGARTLAFVPPAPVAMTLGLDYIPIKRPLYYSNTGTVSIAAGGTAVTFTDGTLLSDGIYTDGYSAELLVGFSTLGDSLLRLDRDYPILSAITSNHAATLLQAWPGGAVVTQPFIVAMVPTSPADVHRWVASLTAARMLRKVSPDLAERYAQGVVAEFSGTVKPAATVRQSQESRVTDDNELLGGLSE